MSQNNTHQLTIRLDDKTYKKLKAAAGERGESMAEVARRKLSQNLGMEVALSVSDPLTAAIRNVIQKELMKTEDRLATNIYKAGLAAASSEQCVLALTQELLKYVPSQTTAFQNKGRHKGTVFLNQSIDVIKAAYSKGEDGIR